MKYSREEYVKFLQTEYDTQMNEYDRLIGTGAMVLKERGVVFVASFQRIDCERGIAIFKMRMAEHMPRKNSFWTASLFDEEMSRFKNWGDCSWRSLRENHQLDFSEKALCVYISKSDDPNFGLIGIKNLSIEFIKRIEEVKPIVAFGPEDPPLRYLKNLMTVVQDKSDTEMNQLLDFSEQQETLWDPQIVDSQTDLTELLTKEIQSPVRYIIQGPPGTGKTYRMAQLAAKLLSQNKSVLIIALTNQALREVASKDSLKQYLKDGKVSKTSLTIDDIKEVSGLRPVVDNECNAAKGFLTLSTFYTSSAWACGNESKPFDFVIMDEVSQAFLATIAASLKLGKNVIWVGDQNQLSPIVLTNEDIISRFNWDDMVKGFSTLCHSFSFPAYMLGDTYRLNSRSADFTGLFYNGNLRSVANYNEADVRCGNITAEGGPIAIDVQLPVGEKAPKDGLKAIWEAASRIIEEKPKAKIAILSKFKESVRALQKLFVMNFQKAELPSNIIIETVDRVQGLTVDYGIYFIPNASVRYSLQEELFNVATSRARYATIVVADKDILGQYMSENVRKFLLKLHGEKFVELKSATTPSPSPLKVVGHVDLSKFERKRTETVEGKENIYIIDTNVFVKCPDIINKIGRIYTILIPATVLEELDKLKLKPTIDKNQLSKASHNIQSAFCANYSRLDDGDMSLLPDGFDKKNPDCRILSVALKYQTDTQHPILLTSDVMLQSRASGLGITTISLKDFIKRPR